MQRPLTIAEFCNAYGFTIEQFHAAPRDFPKTRTIAGEERIFPAAISAWEDADPAHECDAEPNFARSGPLRLSTGVTRGTYEKIADATGLAASTVRKLAINNVERISMEVTPENELLKVCREHIDNLAEPFRGCNMNGVPYSRARAAVGNLISMGFAVELAR